MKVSTKDKMLLYMVGGVLLFVVLFTFVAKPMQKQNQQMTAEITRLEQECRELELLSAGIDTYAANIEEYKNSIREDLKQFPADIKEEDIVMYLVNLQKANKVELYSISINEPEDVISFDGMVEVPVVNEEEETEEAEETAETEEAVTEASGELAYTRMDMTGKRLSVTATSQMTYKEFKNVLKYIYATPTQTSLESVTVTYDSQGEMLNGTFDFSRYIVTYEGAVYDPEDLPDIKIGKQNVFKQD